MKEERALELIGKSLVRGHTRKTRAGLPVQVKQYSTRRQLGRANNELHVYGDRAQHPMPASFRREVTAAALEALHHWEDITNNVAGDVLRAIVQMAPKMTAEQRGESIRALNWVCSQRAVSGQFSEAASGIVALCGMALRDGYIPDDSTEVDVRTSRGQMEDAIAAVKETPRRPG